MQSCDYPAISEYLSKQVWPSARLSGVEVTHVWSQDIREAQKIAQATLIETIVKNPTDMIGSIDGLLLARDDANNHKYFAEPFLKAGLPVYVDKPVALTEARLDALLALQRYPGQIFSCSALRYASELKLTMDDQLKIGKVLLVRAVAPKYWETYAIHLIDPVLNLLGYQGCVKPLFSGNVGRLGRFLAVRWGNDGPDVHFAVTGHNNTEIKFEIFGSDNQTTLVFKDSFNAFKSAISQFLNIAAGKEQVVPEKYNRSAVKIIEMALK